MTTLPHPTNFREERDFGQIVNATFTFIGQHLRPLGKALLFIVSPFVVASAILSGLYQSRVATLAAGEAEGMRTLGQYEFFQQISSFHYLGSLFFTLLSSSLLFLTVYVYLVEHMDANGGRVEVRQVWVRVRDLILPGFYNLFGLIFLVMLGMVLLVLPGIYLAVVLSLFYMVMVREELGFVDAVERCFALIKGYWWPTFWLLLVVGLVQGIIGLVFMVPTMVVSILIELQVPGANSPWLLVAATSLASVAGIFLYTLSAVATAYQYFNLVEIKEGVGLLEQVDRIGAF